MLLDMFTEYSSAAMYQDVSESPWSNVTEGPDHMQFLCCPPSQYFLRLSCSFT